MPLRPPPTTIDERQTGLLAARLLPGRPGNRRSGAAPLPPPPSGPPRHSVGHYARLLRSRANRNAVYGVLIATTAAILATLLVSYHDSNVYSLEAVIHAQRNNAALWLLDAMPLVFAVWGQHTSARMAFEAGALIIGETHDLRAQAAALEERASHDATHDPLTGLPNRRLLRDRIGQALREARREHHGLGLLILDLSGFDEVNNTLGHFSGDRLLSQVAARLVEAVRESDTVARIGGDSFAVLLPNIARPRHTVKIAHKLLHTLETPFQLDGLSVGIQAHAGIVTHPEHGSDADTLLQRAGVAAYAAQKYRQAFIVYDPRLDRHSPERLALGAELRQALDDDGLILRYQPKIDLRTARITGVEALVRWRHPRHGLLAPDQFIPLAEHTGLIRPLTAWVLQHAAGQYAAWRRRGISLGIAVNLSTQNLLDADLGDSIIGILSAHDMPAGRLTLEITESAIMTDPTRALEILRHLHGAGIRIAIDDFGTGYSSLAYLSKLPVSELKIDKAFVRDMMREDKHAVIVRATIDLAHNLSLRVVAEGVEERATYERLRMLGCDVVQGYLTGRPMTAAQLEDRLETIPRRPG